MDKIKEIKERIKTKKQEEFSLQESLRALRKEISFLYYNLLSVKTGLSSGDLVENSEGQRGFLEYPDSHSGFTGWSWRKQKNDGTPSKAVTYLYGSDKIKKVE